MGMLESQRVASRMKYLVVAMDKQAYDTLTKHTNLTVHYLGSNNAGGESTDVTTQPQEFRSKHFNVITAKKKEVVHDIMTLGKCYESA